MSRKNPNKLWKGEGERSAAALNNRGGNSIPYTLDTLATQKRFVEIEWPKRRKAFMHTWSLMSPKGREDLIRAVAPFTPNSPQNPILVINGKQEDVRGACIMFPQLCMSELIPGNKLIELLDTRTDPKEDELDWIYTDYYTIKSLVEANQVKGNVRTMEKKIAFLQPSERFGQSFDITVKPPPKEMMEWFEKEIIINASTFASFFSYQQTLYSFMSGIIDEVKAEIKERDAELPVLLSGCSKCKRQHWAEDASRSIKPCTCFKVAYCSQVCQKEHWPEHKSEHKK